MVRIFMASPAPQIAPFDLDTHTQSVLKLYHQVASFDASVPRSTALEVMARARHPMAKDASAWRIAKHQDNVIGAMEVQFLGTKRTALTIAVHPAFRRRGVAKAFMATWPTGKRLLIESRNSVEAATAFLEGAGFSERHRMVRLRRESMPFDPLTVPSWATLEEDTVKDAERLRMALRHIDGDGSETDLNTLQARLSRPRTRVLYMHTPDGDHGVCMVTANPQVKKAHLDDLGSSNVGLVEDIKLSKAVQKKGLSRPLLRAGLNLLTEDGFAFVEVVSPKKREAAVDLYLQEGFEAIDEDVRWMRRDDE